MKRCFDLAVAALALVCSSPLLLGIALFIKLVSGGPVLFVQERVGRRFRPFRLYKFRTMEPARAPGALITASGDPRITRWGKLLRASKLDELPQLLNVLKGEMSLVGPRPEVARYVELFRSDYAELLSVRPGLTDPASLAYRHEEVLLGTADDPEREYVERILPDKLRLSRDYLRRASFTSDLKILILTAFALGRRARAAGKPHELTG